MIGRDFRSFGKKWTVVRSYQAGDEATAVLRTRFISTSVAVIEESRSIYLHNATGNVEVKLCSDQVKSVHEKNLEERDEWDIHLGKLTEEKKTPYKKIGNIDFDSASDMCYVPSMRCVAITDAKKNQIKLVDLDNFSLITVLGEPFTLHSFDNLSGIDSFNLGDRHFLCTAETGENRVRIWDKDYHCVASLGGGITGGVLPGQFRDPVAVACHIDIEDYKKTKYNSINPVWYLGYADVKELETELMKKNTPGEFRVGRNKKDPKTFTYMYVTQNYRRIKYQIKMAPLPDPEQMKKEEEAKEKAAQEAKEKGKAAAQPQLQQPQADKKVQMGYYMTTHPGRIFKSVYEVIQHQKSIKKYNEVRPYVKVAVAERANFRVQILHYYFLNTDVYKPSLEPKHILGGHNNNLIEINQVTALAYSTSGELAVCDYSKSKISIISPVYELIKTIYIGYHFERGLHVVVEDFDSKEDRRENRIVPNYEKKPKLEVPVEAQPQSNNNNASEKGDTSKKDKNVGTSSEKKGVRGAEGAQRAKRTASEDGSSNSPSRQQSVKMGLSTSKVKGKVGGEAEGAGDKKVNIGESGDKDPARESRRQSQVVTLAPFEPSSPSHRASVLGQGPPGHSRGESSSKSGPGKHRAQIVDPREDTKCYTVSFAKDGKLVVGFKGSARFKSYPIGPLRYLPAHVLDEAMSYLEYDDICTLRNCCVYLHDYTRTYRNNWRIPPMRLTHWDTILYKFRLYGRMPNGLPSYSVLPNFHDRRLKPCCTRYLEHKCIVVNCNDSHQRILVDLHDIEVMGALLEYSDFYIIVTDMYGSMYTWQIEPFLIQLFNNYCTKKFVTIRHDPDTGNRNSRTVVREEKQTALRMLTLPLYMELMTILEEDHSGAKPIYEHPLFNPMRKSKVGSYRDPYSNSLENRPAWVNPLEQYERRMMNAQGRLKNRQFMSGKTMREDRYKHAGKTAKQVHIESFQEESCRYADHLNQMFA